MFSITKKQFTYAQKRETDYAKQGAKIFALNVNEYLPQDTDLATMVKLISEGHMITHVFGDNRKTDANFLYTSIVPIDIDDCPRSIEDSMASITKKPTIAYNTAKNGKDGKYRYRFIYVFKEKVTREHYKPLVKSVEDYLSTHIDGFSTSDNCHERLSQQFMGADVSETAVFVNSECIYGFEDFPHVCNVDGTTAVPRTKKREIVKEDVFGDSEFYKDLKSLDMISFLSKYSAVYECKMESEEIDWRHGAYVYDKETYEAVYKNWCSKGKVHMYVDGEHRRNKFCGDAVQLRRITPNITKENLIFDLLYIIYVDKKYDNSDGVFDSYYIASIADWVINLTEEELFTREYKGKRKGFSVDKEYCAKMGISCNSYKNTVGKKLRWDTFLTYYDSKLSYNENVDMLKEKGMKITKKTISNYIKEINSILKVENEIEYNKEKRERENIVSEITYPEKKKKRYTDEEISEMYDSSLTVMENMKRLRDKGINVGKDRLYGFCKRNNINAKPIKS